MKNYYEEDVALLMQGIPLHHDRGVFAKLYSELSWVDGYAYLLKHYAYARFEPLVFLYNFRRLLDASSTSLVEDLLTSNNLRLQALGLWVCCLVRMPDLRKEIEATATGDVLSSELKLLAIGLSGDTLPSSLVPAEELLRKLRAYLADISPGVFPMRPALDEQLLPMFLEQAAKVKTTYGQGGLDMAKPYLAQPLLRYYQQPHSEWVKAGALPPPTR